MNIDYQKIIEEKRERQADLHDQQAEEHRDEVRERDYLEAQREIEWFRKMHARKKVTAVSISLRSTYIPSINRDKHYLRFFIDGKLQKGFYVSEDARVCLTAGLQQESQGEGAWVYIIFNNQEK